MTYRPDIDGLRAIAVLAVLFFHTGIPGIGGGFVGVDVFFVISGFVIAKTLLKDLEQDRFSIQRFYERRVRRLFPALLFTFALTWALSWHMLIPDDFADFSRSLASSSAFVSNFYFWRYSGYFDTSALLRPLLHTWSLSVEEQFYILAPAMMYICHRFLERRYLVIIVPVIVLSLALSVYASYVAPTANFFILPTRAWELLLGVMLAVMPPPALSRHLREALAAIGLALILFAVTTYSKYTSFPGLTALAPCLGAALLIYSGTNGTPAVNRMLSLRPVVFVGLISYSLYLLHWPLIVFARYATLREPTAFEVAGLLATSFVLAAFSWKYVEQPFRHPDAGRLVKPMLFPGMAAMAVVFGLGAAGVVNDGARWRFPQEIAIHVADPKTWKTGKCFFVGSLENPSWQLDECRRIATGSEKILLWGDSYAAHYVPGLLVLKPQLSAELIQYTAAGCLPVLSAYSYARPGCSEFNRRAIDIIRENGIKTVILSARWVDLEQRGFESLRSTLDELANDKIDVWVIGQTPIFPANVRLIGYRNKDNATDFWPTAIERDINERLRKVVAGAHFIDPLEFLCRDGLCRYRENGSLLYFDTGHFSESGSLRAVRAYFPLVNRNQSAAATRATQ